jgi:hypothetical protein
MSHGGPVLLCSHSLDAADCRLTVLLVCDLSEFYQRDETVHPSLEHPEAGLGVGIGCAERLGPAAGIRFIRGAPRKRTPTISKAFVV